ncbi:MAG: transcriptional regulator NanR [Roseibium sp.]|uniref:transcriptional regulator NanR n=1 Tax=Roseibium sp. TaxID=1936156 RepID=UPI003D9C3677
MSTPTTPIKRRKLSDDVQDRLLEIIRGPDYAPGDLLPSERELMRAYSVGRPAIREAMQNLARMGLIEIRHGERPKVAEPSLNKTVDQLGDTMRHLLRHSPADLAHLKEARIVFEIQMARIAAEKRHPDDISKLVQIVDKQEQSSSESDLFLECDGAFHRAIAEISGNPIFSSLSEAMFGWLAHFHIDLVRKPGLEKLTIKEHRDIIEAIADRDEVRAAKAMTDHLNRANALYHRSHDDFSDQSE